VWLRHPPPEPRNGSEEASGLLADAQFPIVEVRLCASLARACSPRSARPFRDMSPAFSRIWYHVAVERRRLLEWPVNTSTDSANDRGSSPARVLGHAARPADPNDYYDARRNLLARARIGLCGDGNQHLDPSGPRCHKLMNRFERGGCVAANGQRQLSFGAIGSCARFESALGCRRW
jgi:hypothetical protein